MMTYSLRATRYLVWKSVDWMRTATFLFQLCSLRSPCQCLVSKYLPKRILNAGLTCLLLLCHRYRLVLTCLSATTFLRLQNLGRWSTQLIMLLMQFVRFWAGPSMALWGVPLALMIGIKLCLAEFKWPLDWKISYRNSSVLTSVSSLYFLARRHFQLRTKSSWRWSIVKPFCEMVITRSAFPWEMHRLLCPTLFRRNTPTSLMTSLSRAMWAKFPMKTFLVRMEGCDICPTMELFTSARTNWGLCLTLRPGLLAAPSMITCYRGRILAVAWLAFWSAFGRSLLHSWQIWNVYFIRWRFQLINGTCWGFSGGLQVMLTRKLWNVGCMLIYLEQRAHQQSQSSLCERQLLTTPVASAQGVWRQYNARSMLMIACALLPLSRGLFPSHLSFER